MKLYGYKRPDGKVGIRNKVLILPTCVCSAETKFSTNPLTSSFV